MDNQQHLYGNPANFSSNTMNINDGVYQMNPSLSINPVNEAQTSGITQTIPQQQPVFYNEAYPNMSGVVASNTSPGQQSYNIQPNKQQISFSHPVLSNQHPNQQQNMTMQPVSNQSYQDNQSTTHLANPISSMLSFQPLPQQQTANINTVQQNLSQPNQAPGNQMNFQPNFQASTPPPLSQLQGVTIYPQQQPQVISHPSPSTPMEETIEESQTFKAPTFNKAPKSRSPKKKATHQVSNTTSKTLETTSSAQIYSDSSLTQSPVASPQGSSTTNQAGTSFPKLKDLVGRLLSCTLDAFTDKDFGEKTLMNLARKLSSSNISSSGENGSVLQIWENAIQQKNAQSGCVCISRPREGRITVTKSGANSSGSKKVFPQIVLCQMFRFPNIVFHHDIKSSDYCQNPAAVKPNIPGSGGELGEIGSDQDGTTDIICLNPYHYVVSPEAQARFLKQDKKAAREALKEGNVPPPSASTYSTSSLSTSSAYDPNFSNPTAQNLNKKKSSNKKHVPIYMQHKYDDLSPGVSYKSKMNQPKQSEIVDLSSDDDESDDEVHHFEDDGINYVKLWEEQARFPDGTSGAMEEINEKDAFEEIKFLSWSADDKKFSETEKALLEELKVYEEFKSLIISGSYLDVIKEIKKSKGEADTENNRQKMSALNSNVKSLSDKNEPKFQSADAMNQLRAQKDSEPSPDIILQSITDDHGDSLYPKEGDVSIIADGSIPQHQFITPINITTSASDKTLSSAFVDDDDESCGETSGSNLSLNLMSSIPGGSSNRVSNSQNMEPRASGSRQPPIRASEEDNVIQDLLKDIRGSFERQFDDEFDFSESTNKEDSEPVSGVIGSSSTHHSVGIRSGGVSPNSFGVSLDSDFNINPEEAAEVAAAVADMDIPDSDFLDPGSISQEELDTFSSLLGETTSASSIQPSSVNADSNHLSSNGPNQEHVFQFQQNHPQNPQFDLFQHPTPDDSDDFPF